VWLTQTAVLPPYHRNVTAESALLARWREELAAWAIPERITSAVPDSPWVLPREVFTRRADRAAGCPAGVTFERAWEALEPPGTVLDVGAGAGAASLPLAGRTRALTAVDSDPELLARLSSRAKARGLDTTLVTGRWPDAAAQVPVADVVTCAHVVYNVPDLGPFLAALTSHARRRVVVEMTTAHPLTSLNPLWLRFHGLERPDGPAAADLLAILAESAVPARHTEWERPAAADYASFTEFVEVTRRRLCLPAERAGEVEAALLEAGVTRDRPVDMGSSGRDVVTIWWEGTA
jgi:SAM-dependent methyltransferase